jgi:hypothetical protein
MQPEWLVSEDLTPTQSSDLLTRREISGDSISQRDLESEECSSIEIKRESGSNKFLNKSITKKLNNELQ